MRVDPSGASFLCGTKRPVPADLLSRCVSRVYHELRQVRRYLFGSQEPVFNLGPVTSTTEAFYLPELTHSSGPKSGFVSVYFTRDDVFGRSDAPLFTPRRSPDTAAAFQQLALRPSASARFLTLAGFSTPVRPHVRHPDCDGSTRPTGNICHYEGPFSPFASNSLTPWLLGFLDCVVMPSICCDEQ